MSLSCRQQASLNVHRGQAMAEFVVTVAFIFLALFVLVPTFGKLLDLKFQHQMASRYLAWERTVWWESVDGGDDNQDDFVIGSDEFESVATRSDLDVMNSLNSRFFAGQGSATIKKIQSSDADGSAGSASPLWTYIQSGESMYRDTLMADAGRDLDEKDTPSVAYDVIDVVQTGLNAVQSPLSSFLDFGGNDNTDLLAFDYNLKGYYRPELTTRLDTGAARGGDSDAWDRDGSGNWGSGIENAIFDNWDGKLVSRSAILADGWNAQSEAYYQDRADNFVLSSIFDFGFVDDVLDLVGYLEGGNPDNSPIANFEFGAVGIEPMPAADGEIIEPTCDDGFCYYDE